MNNSQRHLDLERKAKRTRSKIYQGSVFDLFKDAVEYETKGRKEYDIIRHPGAVGILPVDKNGDIVCVEQYRVAAERIFLEIPAGCLEPREDPLACAHRELREETGFKAGRMEEFGELFMSPAILHERITLFIATDLTIDPLFAEDTDQIDVFTKPLCELLGLIKNGHINDAKTICALLKYQNFVEKKDKNGF